MLVAADPAASTMRSLDRAISVLEVLEGSPGGLRLSEVARRADLHVATTQRILGALEARGRVERDDGRYRAGVALLFGAHAYLQGSPLVLNARSVLQDLASSTGLASSVFVRTGMSRAVIARVEGSDPLRYELPIGERLPLHVGAGKVLAAYLDDAEREELIASATPYTTAEGEEVTASDLRTELDEIRDRGFAVSSGERVYGARSVVAPVWRDGVVVAALQVAGTTATLPTERVEPLAAAIRNAAADLGRRL
jgi:DNA-binding IclR family transcriptional regulator